MDILIALLVLVVVVAVAVWLIDQLPPSFPKQIVKVVVVAVALIYLVVTYLPLLHR